MAQFVTGSLQVIIPKALDSSDMTGIINVLIKNVNVQMINLTRDPIINEGVLTNGVITSASYIKKKNWDIKLTNGTGPYGCSKGAFSSDLQTYPGLNIIGLQRNPGSTYYNTQKLAMQSFLSQYKEPRYVLRGVLNMKDYYLSIPRLVIYDSTYLKNIDNSTKYFCVVSASYRDREEVADVELLEICTVREGIV